MMMALVLSIPIWAGEKTVTISRNEGIYDDGTGVYYCTKGGITMTFSSGLNNVNYLVEHQQIVFDIFSTNYVIKKIKFNCLDNTTDDNLDCFYWGPSTIHEFNGAPYTPTGTYTYSGYIGTWVGGSTPSKYVKFETEAKPVRFGSVEITYDKEVGDIFDLVTQNTELEPGHPYVLVSKYDSRAFGKEEYHGNDPVTTFSSTPVTLLNYDSNYDNYLKVKVTDEVSFMKLESSGNSDRPWYIKIGDNYMRRRSGDMQGSGGAANGQGYNLYTESSVPSGREQFFRTRITVENPNNNALIRYYHTTTETSNNEYFAIRHYNGGDLFRVIDYNTANNQYATNQRVYLYRPARSYEVTTECIPSNGGYITLGDGILINQGRNWSQHCDNVTFFVGPTNGWGVGVVTLTDINTKAVTTLTPTGTSDFGNDYSFEMPENDVKITANFLQPYDIHTVNSPANGGDFNFTNGYTDFNGQTMSNEGKTVTFEVTPADGYVLNSVTYTDDVTGQTSTLTPNNGEYSFTMPGNNVTVTANYEEAHDLYLLGTANGETAWHPYGPQFTFDGANQEYYIDVYFKGDSLYNNGQGDPYGHFSLTKKISQDPNGWGEISGYRIYAASQDYWVEDGNTYNNCFQTSTDYAFKLPAGVYRITVSKDLDQMTISEYKPTLVFTPEGGQTQDNPTLVDAGTEVTMTSNLEQLVHDINPNESSHATFYNTTDNWATNEHDNTRVISDDGVTTLIANANLGYIKAQDTVYYEVVGDLYLLGTANGRSAWVPYGPQFTYDANAQEYSIDVYFKGYNDDANAEDGFGYFSLSTKIGSNDNDWGSISGYRLYATSHDYLVGDGTVANNCFQASTDQAFKIPAGVYHITVNKAKTQMSITEYPTTLTFNPVSGTTVAAGDNVTITSNLDQLVHAINPNEEAASFKYATSTDGTLPTPNIEGSTVTITAVNATTTVNAQANIGYIKATGSANYIVPAPTVYSISTVVTPEGSNAGVITAPAGALAGETVTFTVTDNNANVYTLDQVEVVNSLNQIIPLTDNGDGTYTFTMPDDEVTIYADYVKTPHNLTTNWSPLDGGYINFYGDNVITPQTVQRQEGDNVVFVVTPAADYYLKSLIVWKDDANPGTIIDPSSSSGTTYRFTMPAYDTHISAQFAHLPYNITTQVTPQGGGVITLLGNAADNNEEAGKTVTFSVDVNTGFAFNSVTVTIDGTDQTVRVTDNGDGTYSFTMPEGDVTVTADFIDLYEITTVCTPPEGGNIVVTTDYALDGTEIEFTVNINSGYALTSVVVTNNDTQGNINYSYENGTYSFTMPDGDVTIQATLSTAYHVTTVVIPDGFAQCDVYWADYPEFTEFAANTPMTVEVSPNAAYKVQRITLTNNTTDEVTELTLSRGPHVASQFTMPNSDVTVTVYLSTMGEIFKVVKNPRELMEGKTYTLVNQAGSKVLNYIAPDVTPNYYSSTDIVGWPNGNDKTLVELDENACFFTLENVTDTLQNSPLQYKKAYLKTAGGYIGADLDVDPDEDPITHFALYSSREDVKKFTMTQDATYVVKYGLLYYDWNSGSAQDAWVAYYDISEGFMVEGDRGHSHSTSAEQVWIYKLCEPFSITTVVTPEGSGTLELSGDYVSVVDMTAMDGTQVTVMPHAADGYALDHLVVTVDGYNETVPVTYNAGGSCSFVMPTGDVTVTAYFDEGYKIHTVCNPPEGGQIIVASEAVYDAEVPFEVVPNDGYALIDLKITFDETGEEIDIEDDGDYFFMWEGDVTITATFEVAYPVNTVVVPAGSAQFEAKWIGHNGVTMYPEGTQITANLTPELGCEVQRVTLTNNTTGEVTELSLYGMDGKIYVYKFDMPASAVTLTAYLFQNTPLGYIERYDTYKDGDHVTVTDDLIGVWMAKQYVWAKDMQTSNVYLEDQSNAPDFIREYMNREVGENLYIDWQPRAWDQSNWVMLDFSQIPGFEDWETNPATREAMSAFVDHTIDQNSISGTYHCLGEPMSNYESGDDYPKVQHIIVLDALPRLKYESEDSQGYPGYHQDPKEWKDRWYSDPSDYRYNHYMTYNFRRGNTKSSGCNIGDESYDYYIDELGLNIPTKFFFMTPKDQEVAQVWGVWAGSKTFTFNGERITGDVFNSYKFTPAEGINKYAFKGAFYVPSWEFNRLVSSDEYNDPHYGKPGVDDGGYPLEIGQAYLFHAAIMYPNMIEDEPPVNAPRHAPVAITSPNYYSVYPLDMMSAPDAYTAVREIKSPATTEIVSITYYNMLGQESETPFEGINLMVTRYKDGSFTTMKILK